MQPNSYQQAAIDCDGKRIVLIAGAGSGKTATLTKRLARLMQAGWHPSEILAVTFTRASAADMRERVVEVAGPRARQIQMCTLHSLCASTIRTYADKVAISPTFSIYDEQDEGDLLAFAAVELGDKKISEARAAAEANGEPYRLHPRTRERLQRDPRIVARVRQLLREAQALTYDGLETTFLALLQQPEIAAALRHRWRHVLVDECQDLSEMQHDILAALAPEHLFLVGDVAQCQPAGTEVLTPRGLRNIETLRDGDEVCGWDRRGAHVYTRNGSKVKVACRQYTGDLYTIVTESGKRTTTTDTHRWAVKWDRESADDLHCIYVMFHNGKNAYRIGWCKVLIQSQDCCQQHYKQRARLEHADACWIVEVHRDRGLSSIRESIMATVYGIPLIMFHEVNASTLYTQERLDYAWDQLSQLSRAGFERLAEDYNLDVVHPHFYKGQPGGRQTVFECVAAGLRDGMMVPVYDGINGYTWEKIVSIERASVDGVQVYSLDVERHHAYVADGLCTLNSIYGFRGARADRTVELMDTPDWTVLTLPTNYRSLPPIVSLANKIAEHMETPGLVMEAARPDDGSLYPVGMPTGPDREQLHLRIAEDLTNQRESAAILDVPVRWADYAILSPTWDLLERIAQVLEAAGIPHRIARRALDVWETSEARQVIDCLRVASNPWDHLSLRRALGGSVPTAAWAALRAKALQAGVSPLEATFGWMCYPALDSVQAAQKNPEDALREVALTLRLHLDSLHLATRGAHLDALVKAWETWRDAQPENERTAQHLLTWYSERRITDPEVQDEADAVTLTTIHGAKGLEWPCVWVLGLEEGRFPRHGAEGEDLEEARRLFYVAITRARDRLRMCYAGHHERSSLLDALDG